MTTVFFYYKGKQGKPFYFFKDILFFQQYRFKEVKKFFSPITHMLISLGTFKILNQVI